MIKRQGKAAAVLVGATGLLLLGSSAAFAYWTTSGSGAVTSSAPLASPLTVTGTSNVTGLYPTATDVAGGSVTVGNSNDFGVKLTTANFGSITVDSGHSACNVSSVSFAVGTIPTATVAAGGGTAIVPFTASMTNNANDFCQGATFTATLTVNAQSSAS